MPRGKKGTGDHKSQSSEQQSNQTETDTQRMQDEEQYFSEIGMGKDEDEKQEKY